MISSTIGFEQSCYFTLRGLCVWGISKEEVRMQDNDEHISGCYLSRDFEQEFAETENV